MTKTATKKNAEKKNENVILTVSELFNVFSTELVGVPVKVNYSDAKAAPYTGLDSFSVNVKKKGYNVYMSASNAELCKKQVGTLEVHDNPCDTTKKQLRCKLIQFTDSEQLVDCIKLVCKAVKPA